MMELDLIIGSGGVLSHAPKRAQTVAMLIDAYQPEGITCLAVDSIFMMPHLGVLATVNEKAAQDVFDRDCLVNLGTVVSPVGKGKERSVVLRYEIEGAESGELLAGELKLLPLPEKTRLSISPERGFDVGRGPGNEWDGEIFGGEVGLVLDGRGRPIAFSESLEERHRATRSWAASLELY
jgi:hypothetical protein